MSIKDLMISKSSDPFWQQIVQYRIKLHNAYLSYWLKSNLFSLGWWLSLILFISLWFIWWKRVNKAKLHEIITLGLLVSLIGLLIDIVGCEYVLWGYPIDLLPFIPPLFVTDFSMLPVAYMLVYQYFAGWKSFTLGTIIASALIAFAAQPLAELLGIYELNNWKHWYDFPLYILLGLFAKWIMSKIMAKQNSC